MIYTLFTGEMGCSEEITTILSMLQVQNVFIRPVSGQAAIKARIARRLFEAAEGDLITMLNVYAAYEKNKTNSWCQKYFVSSKALRRATEIRTQMRKLIKRLNIPLESCGGMYKSSSEPERKKLNFFSFLVNIEPILKCLTVGLFSHAAYLHYSGVYRTVRGNKDLHIAPNSCLYTLEQPQW